MPLLRPATPPIPPASGFENEEPLVEDVVVASVDDIPRPPSGASGRRLPRPQPPRRSSSGSLASTVAAKRRQSKIVEVIEPPLGSNSTGAVPLKKGYDCCSKREKSSALAALIGCISLATLMTSLITDLWLDTDEWIPSVDTSTRLARPDLMKPNVQPRHQEGTGEAAAGHQEEATIRRVHFAVGLWTVCPSHEDASLKGKFPFPLV